jgi:hypothetical protein
LAAKAQSSSYHRFQHYLDNTLENSRLQAKGQSDSSDLAALEQDTLALTAHALNTDISLHSATGLRKAMQEVIGPLTTKTNTGMSIGQLREAKRNATGPPKANSLVVNEAARRESRFYRNGLSATKITPSSNTMPQNLFGIQDSENIPNAPIAFNQLPTVQEADPVAKRIKRLRMQLGKDMMDAKRAGSSVDANTKALHGMLQFETPQKQVQMIVHDGLICGYSTLEMKDHLELSLLP